MKGKLQEYALVAEIIGGLAIVASLIFVGLQIQQNSKTTQAQTRTALTVIALNNIQNAKNPDIIEMVLALDKGEPLTGVQNIYRAQTTMQTFRTAENVFYQHRVATFDDEEFEGYRNYYKRQFSQPYILSLWESNKAVFSKSFQQDIEALIIEIEADSDKLLH